MAALIATAKFDDINPHAWLADMLARIADQLASRRTNCYPDIHRLITYRRGSRRTVTIVDQIARR